MNIKSITSKALWILLLGLSASIFSACETDGRSERSTGKTNEILVVTNYKSQWEGEMGYVIRKVFEQPLAGLPQPEPMYRLFNIAEKDFNKLFKSQHNIMIVDIDPSFKEPLVETRRDYWTKPQRVIKITAPDTASFRKAFEEHSSAFLKSFNELEIIRTNVQFAMARSVSLMNTIQNKFGFSLQLPGGFTIADQTDDFMWLRQTIHKTKQDVEMGIMIISKPYNDTSSFMGDSIIELRDAYSSEFIPGPSDGSYMIVSRGFIEPVFKRTDEFVTGFAVETRGLWMVENDFMGGPFISFTFVDPTNKKVITLDGYVYNPSGLKRNFVRQMEAIFHTIEFK